MAEMVTCVMSFCWKPMTGKIDKIWKGKWLEMYKAIIGKSEKKYW